MVQSSLIKSTTCPSCDHKLLRQQLSAHAIKKVATKAQKSEQLHTTIRGTNCTNGKFFTPFKGFSHIRRHSGPNLHKRRRRVAFMTESKSQTQQMLSMTKQQNLDRKEDQAERREQQSIQNDTNTGMDKQFEQMLQAFTRQATVDPRPKNSAPAPPTDPTKHQTKPQKNTRTRKKKKPQKATPVDTAPAEHTDYAERPMEMDDESLVEQAPTSNNEATSSDDESSGPSHKKAESQLPGKLRG